MRIAIALVVTLAGCGGASPAAKVPAPPADTPRPDVGQAPPAPNATCGGKPMRVKFYDAGQALAALVTLPDGRHILVDAGESPKKSKDAHQRVLDGLAADLAGAKIDLLWNTHQHSDHLGGVPGVMAAHEVLNYAHNGVMPKSMTDVVQLAMDAAVAEKATITVVEPGNAVVPIAGTEEIKLTAIVPGAWPKGCDDNEANECSILLRIDYCESSILFTGDAEHVEEGLLAVGQADVLQVGHHGSNTSTTDDFLEKVKPTHAVISSGQPDKGTNSTYCHPFKSTIDKLNKSMGGAGTKTIRAFDPPAGKKCKDKPRNWVDVPANDNVLATSRDGGILLTTNGDGKFAVTTEK